MFLVYNDTIPAIDIIFDHNLYLSLSFNVSNKVLTMYTNNTNIYQVTGVCNGQHPTIANILLITNDGSVISATNIELPTAMYNSIIRADNVLMVQEDQVYTVVVSLHEQP